MGNLCLFFFFVLFSKNKQVESITAKSKVFSAYSGYTKRQINQTLTFKVLVDNN